MRLLQKHHIENGISEFFQLTQGLGLSAHILIHYEMQGTQKGGITRVRNRKMCFREVREMQIETTTTYFSIHTTITIIKNTENIKHWRRYREIRAIT